MQIKKILIILAILVLSAGAGSGDVVFAKKALGSRKTVATRSVSQSSGGAPTKIKFRSDRRAIIVNFSNLNNYSKVTYTFSYSTRGTTQGSTGSVPTTSSTQVREFPFGTCSGSVCRYDSGITNAKFTVVSTATSGKKYSKTSRLKP